MDNLISLFDQLKAEIEAKMAEVSTNDANAEQLKERDLTLRAFEKKLNTIDEGQRREKERVESEKAYIEKRSQEIAIKEETVKKLEDLREKVRVESEELNAKKELLSEQADSLGKVEKDLVRREELMRKELLLDRERKQQLNAQEIANRTEAERLQRIAESLGQ